MALTEGNRISGIPKEIRSSSSTAARSPSLVDVRADAEEDLSSFSMQ